MIFNLLGIFGALLFIYADSLYVRDVLRGTTKPQRMSWGIGTALSIIGFANQLASGATSSLWIFGSAVIMVGLIFLLSLKRGVGGGGRADLIALAISAAGVLLWVVFSDPFFSVVASLVAFVALMSLNFAKARTDPDSETLSTWFLAGLSSAINTVAVGSLDIDLLLLPLAGAILQFIMSYIIWSGRKRTA